MKNFSRLLYISVLGLADCDIYSIVRCKIEILSNFDPTVTESDSSTRKSHPAFDYMRLDLLPKTKAGDKWMKL